MVLEEFDVAREAIINPHHFVERLEQMPKVAVTCFGGKTFDRLVQCMEGERIGTIHNANTEFPIYKATYKGKEVALYLSDVGAPGAGAALDELYALGVEKVVVFGSCGVLDKNIEDCSIIIPNAAVRDEGMSYHYAPPSDEIEVNLRYVLEFTKLLTEIGCSYTIGKVWTTDAFYRETKEKMLRRKAQGCICVDMECSALAAVARFREKEIFQFFYAADNLDGEEWDERSLNSDLKFSEKDRFAQLALEVAVIM